MKKYEYTEKFRLYYFQPSYWRKIRRVCGGCGVKYTKAHKVNYGVMFQLPKTYYHYECLPKDVAEKL